MIGTQLDGRYRILSKLGEGGMGEAYLAEHINLGRKEALKILLPALAADPEFVARFRREARATNRVQHANIVCVYDFGRLPDGRFYLSMEYAEGERLDAVLLRLGPLPVPRVLHILGQLADAVNHAHERGVVHRDLKPENMVLVEHRGQADFLKILDFGIAKIVAPDHTESVILSNKGQVFGTPSYMSPEQAEGMGTDPRSDIYSIGCVAFELLVGEPPFLGRSSMQLMHAHKSKAPARPSQRRPQAGIPAELDAIVLRCLQKDPARRFPTGADLLAALHKVPGYRSKKSPSGRRSQSLLPRPSDYAAPPDTQETPGAVRFMWEDTGADAPAYAATEPLEAGGAAPDLRGRLCQVAERLSDLGVNDVALIVGVAHLKDLDDTLRRQEAEMDALDLALSDVEQATREREGSLRFALGEVMFVRNQAASNEPAANQDLDYQIRELEKRLAEATAESEREQTALMDRLIALTASHATTQETLVSTYDALERLVDEILPRFERHPTIAPLVAALRDARGRRLTPGNRPR